MLAVSCGRLFLRDGSTETFSPTRRRTSPDGGLKILNEGTVVGTVWIGKKNGVLGPIFWITGTPTFRHIGIAIAGAARVNFERWKFRCEDLCIRDEK